jgi:glycosyltransferase involved in cell wall biosynthesis
MNEGNAEQAVVLPSDISLLHIATVPAPIRNFYIPYATHFRSLGWRVDAAAFGCTSVSAITEAFDAVYDLPFSRSVRDVRSLIDGESAVRDLLYSVAPDIVHVHTPIASLLTRLAVHRMPADRRPMIAYTAHGFHFYRGGNPVANMAFLTAERLAGRWTDRLVVINDEDEAAARRWRVVSDGRLIRMPGVGIDTEFYARGRVDVEAILLLRKRLGIGEGTPLFVSIAELHPNKRHERTIEALSLMENTDTHLAIAGDGEFREKLESAASRSGVAHRVHFLGFLADIRPLLVGSTGFVLASGREGLARSLMEALSLGVPAIASDARGNGELIGADGGIIVPQSDSTELAAAMDRMVADPELALAIGQRGRQRMVRTYSQRAVIAMHDQMYAGMLEERVTRSRLGQNASHRARRRLAKG